MSIEAIIAVGYLAFNAVMFGWAAVLAIKTARHNKEMRRLGLHHLVLGPF